MLNGSHPYDDKVHKFTREFGRRSHFNNRVNVSSDQLMNCLHSLGPFKAPGVDGIQNILLKNLPESGVKLLCRIFNSAIRLKFCPSSFKNAKVIPIPKPGKDGSAVVTRHIRLNWSQRRSTGMVLFDIEKAFDSVWHDGLIFKLKHFGYLYLCGMIRESIKNRTFTVHLGDTLSEPNSIPAGLPQGSILSPSLYSIYVSDLKFNSHTDSACYADDTAIYASTSRTGTIIKRLQSSLNSVQNFFDKWRINANPKNSGHRFGV